MIGTLSSALAALLYSAGTLYLAQSLLRRTPKRPQTGLLLSLGIPALLFHALALVGMISTHQGLDLGISRSLSAVSWLISALCLLSSNIRPVNNLLLVLFPFQPLTCQYHPQRIEAL